MPHKKTDLSVREIIFKLRRENGEPARLLSPIRERDNLSRLVVPTNGPLLLPDYGKEIELTPLQKKVFIFFLNHPDGLLFKKLPRHREELLSVYRMLSN